MYTRIYTYIRITNMYVYIHTHTYMKGLWLHTCKTAHVPKNASARAFLSAMSVVFYSKHTYFQPFIHTYKHPFDVMFTAVFCGLFT